MDFKKYLETGAHQVDEELERILSQLLTEVKNTNIKLTPFALGLINSCKGGKRIRGVLVKLGYELGEIYLRGEKNALHLGRGLIAQGGEGEIIKIGAAFEILHAALLIHDDIADKSLTRRGQPSLYQALGGDHYGISQAINIGDIGLYLPIKIITESNFLGEAKIKVLSHLSQIIINTGWGQIMDVELNQSKPPWVSTGDPSALRAGPPEVIEFININKTAKYTIAAPLQIGAILTGADEKLIRELGEFGENAGVAFQMQDDILDGEAVDMDQIKAEALKYALEAKKIIPKITRDERMKKLLEQMVEYLVERRK